MRLGLIVFAVLWLTTGFANAHPDGVQINIQVYLIDKNGPAKIIGVVSAADTDNGLLLTPDLRGLPPGRYGFHVHELADCGFAMDDKGHVGFVAGSRYDNLVVVLPVLQVGPDGRTHKELLVPRASVAMLMGRALIIHAEPDNLAIHPPPRDGAGERIACGPVP